jgi:hypothetical protein
MNDSNRIEVWDKASDVVVYDVERHEIVTDSVLSSIAAFETFPTFSPDGKTLYFCSAIAQDAMPRDFKKVKYNLCSIAFDPEARSFGTLVDTVFHASSIDKSVSFPRVSPDGRFLVFTLSSYGNFSIWHRDADLYMLNIANGQAEQMTAFNSDDVESYHSWSGNSRWLVFSSRRIDGLYTRPFFGHIDENGRLSKPFLLPQKDVGFYSAFMKSYNIPEFILGKVNVNRRELALEIKNSVGTDVSYAGSEHTATKPQTGGIYE